MKKFRIGYTTGVYDMFHIGHLNILRRAKEQCETLVVGVTTDELCYQRKHKYPIINEQERMAIVGAIRYVDKVIPQTDMEKVRPVKKLGADVVFVGSDWKGTEAWNQYEKEYDYPQSYHQNLGHQHRVARFFCTLYKNNS